MHLQASVSIRDYIVTSTYLESMFIETDESPANQSAVAVLVRTLKTGYIVLTNRLMFLRDNCHKLSSVLGAR